MSRLRIKMLLLESPRYDAACRRELVDADSWRREA
jgi:hypothetical protein